MKTDLFVAMPLQAQRDEVQKKLNDAKKIIAESETTLMLAVAEAKRNLHASLEAKDDELAQCRETIRLADVKVAELKQQMAKMELSGMY